MNRMGRRHRPFFRINAVEKKTQRDGKVLEALGWYDPLVKDEGKSIQLNEERIKAWIARGAQPSDSVGDILAARGIIDADEWKTRRMRKVTKKMERIVADKKAAEEAAAAEAAAKAKEEAEAKAKAEAEAAAAAAESDSAGDADAKESAEGE